MSSPTATPTPAAIAASAHASRVLHNVDRARILCMIDIVSFHASFEGARIWGGGFPFLVLLSMVLSFRRHSPEPVDDFVGRKFSRLIVPWLFWCGVYLVLRATLAIYRGEPAFGWAEPAMVLYGPWIHLWYLPFIFAALCLTRAAHGRIATVSTASLAMWGIPLSIVLAAPGIWAAYTALPAPVGQWVYALGMVVPGYLLARAMGRRDDAEHFLVLWLGVATVLVAGSFWVDNEVIRRWGYGMVVMGIVMAWPGRSDGYSHALASLFYGVYVIHPIFIAMVWDFAPGDRSPNWALRVGFAMVCSIGAAYLIKQTAWGRRVI